MNDIHIANNGHRHGGLAEHYRVKCENCGWTGEHDDTDWISGANERLCPGEEIPAGQCPECGSLVYVAPPTAEDNLAQAIGIINHGSDVELLGHIWKNQILFMVIASI